MLPQQSSALDWQSAQIGGQCAGNGRYHTEETRAARGHLQSVITGWSTRPPFAVAAGHGEHALRVGRRGALVHHPSCTLPGAGDLLPLLPSLNASPLGLFDHRQERAEDEVKRRLVGIDHLQYRVHRPRASR
jgi:hypothetical protein